MAPRLLPVQRQTIIALHKAGTKVIDISRWTGITRKSIYTWLKRHEETGSLTELHRQNYKKSTTNEQDTQIIAQHMYNPSQSTIATATQYNVSPRTIRRRLLDAGVRQKRERKKSAKPKDAKQPGTNAAKKQSKKKPLNPPEAPTDAWPYKCQSCGDLFRVRADLQNHSKMNVGCQDKKKGKKKEQAMGSELMLHQEHSNSLHSDQNSTHSMPLPMTMAAKKPHEQQQTQQQAQQQQQQMSSFSDLIPMMMKKTHEHTMHPNYDLPIPMMTGGKRMHEQPLMQSNDLPIPMMMNNRKPIDPPMVGGPSWPGRLWGAHYALEPCHYTHQHQ